MTPLNNLAIPSRNRSRLRLVALTSIAFGFVAMGIASAQIFVTDDDGITKFTAPQTAGSLFYSDLNEPAGLAYHNGSIYVSNYSTGTIQKLSLTGTATTFASGFSHLEGIAFDGSGNLFILNQAGQEIDEISATGTRSVFATTGLAGAVNLAFDSSGNLYATNLQNNTIEKFTSNGTASLFATTNLNEPDGIAFDNGNLYVSSFGNNLIEKFTLAGVGSTFLSASPATTGPLGLTTDSAGDLWVTNNGNQGIYEITLGSSGTASSVVRYSGDGSFPSEILVVNAPEPTTWVMLLGGLGLLAFRFSRARQR